MITPPPIRSRIGGLSRAAVLASRSEANTLGCGHGRHDQLEVGGVPDRVLQCRSRRGRTANLSIRARHDERCYRVRVRCGDRVRNYGALLDRRADLTFGSPPPRLLNRLLTRAEGCLSSGRPRPQPRKCSSRSSVAGRISRVLRCAYGGSVGLSRSSVRSLSRRRVPASRLSSLCCPLGGGPSSGRSLSTTPRRARSLWARSRPVERFGFTVPCLVRTSTSAGPGSFPSPPPACSRSVG